jgi:hypothetical protein
LGVTAGPCLDEAAVGVEVRPEGGPERR